MIAAHTGQPRPARKARASRGSSAASMAGCATICCTPVTASDSDSGSPRAPSAGVATVRPSIAPSTGIAGVVTPSP